MKYLRVTSGEVICLSHKGPLRYNFTGDPASVLWLHKVSETEFDQHNLNGYMSQS